jgi:hypothetical protein
MIAAAPNAEIAAVRRIAFVAIALFLSLCTYCAWKRSLQSLCFSFIAAAFAFGFTREHG